jgi:hypothetical protein
LAKQRWGLLLQLGARGFGFGIALDMKCLGGGGCSAGVRESIQGIPLEQGAGEWFRESLGGVITLLGNLTWIRDAGS